MPQPELFANSFHSISFSSCRRRCLLDDAGSSNEPGGVLQPPPSRVIGSTVHMLTPACFLAAGSMALSTPREREMLLLQVESVYGSRHVSTQSSGGRAACAYRLSACTQREERASASSSHILGGCLCPALPTTLEHRWCIRRCPRCSASATLSAHLPASVHAFHLQQ